MKRLLTFGVLTLSLLTACGQKAPENEVVSETSGNETSVKQNDATSIGLGVRPDREAQPQPVPDPPVSTSPDIEKTTSPIAQTEEQEPASAAEADALGDWGGVWDTSYGEMRLKEIHPTSIGSGEPPPVRVTGTYDTDQGQIDGVIYDGSLYGLWAETSSAQKCETPQLGSYYWGGIVYQKVDVNSFQGIWTYCKELGPGFEASDPDVSAWDGTRISPVGSQPIREDAHHNDDDLRQSQVSFRGIWDTSEGEMKLAWADHVTVTGTYDQDGGRIIGNVEGNLKELNGYWIENGSAQRCDTPRQGSYHWGRVQFVLNEDDSEFDGTWSYCDAEPSSRWTGKRTS